VDGTFVRLKETLTTSFPELEVRHDDRKSDSGWTEKQAMDSALLENPLTVFMYCLHALRVNVQDAFPPTMLATVVDAEDEEEVTTEVGGATTDVGGATNDGDGVEDEVGGVDEEEEEEQEEDENVADNAITIEQISDWLKVNLYTRPIID